MGNKATKVSYEAFIIQFQLLCIEYTNTMVVKKLGVTEYAFLSMVNFIVVLLLL